MYSVLIVCSANICRSPMAMGLLQDRAAASQGDWRIESAGVWARPGYAAAENTQLVLNARGLDLSAHRSRPVSAKLLADFNLILTMERGQREALRMAFPDHADRIFMLSEMAGRHNDIVDPIGGPPVDFEDTARELETLLDRGFDQISRLAADPSPD